MNKLLLCADEKHLGRLEYDYLNDQQRMEFLISKANNKKIFRDSHGNFLDTCEWDDITCVNDNVKVIAWNHDWGVVDLQKGTVELDWLPPLLTKVNMSDQYMEGTLETKLLPQGIEQIYLGCNYLSGTLDMLSLPSSLRILHLDCNCFTGDLVLTSLPPKLKELELDENKFCIEKLTVDFPKSITSYAFDGNDIKKIVDVHGKELPEALL